MSEVTKQFCRQNLLVSTDGLEAGLAGKEAAQVRLPTLT